MEVTFETEDAAVLIALGVNESELELACAEINFEVDADYNAAEGNDFDDPRIEEHYSNFNICSQRVYVDIEGCSAEYKMIWDTKELPDTVREAINDWLERETDNFQSDYFEENEPCI